MKRIIFTLAIILGFGMTLQAQTELQVKQAQQQEYESVREEVKALSNSLGLTDKQAALMRKNLTDYEARKQEVANSNGTAKQKSQKIIKIEEMRIEATRDILTKPQYDKYVKLSGAVQID